MRPSRTDCLFRSIVRAATCLTAATALLATSTRAADDPPRPDSPLVKMLRGGRLPTERQGTIVEMIGRRGTAADLDFLLDRAIDPKGFAPANRLKALNALAEAAMTRNTRPAGDLGRLAALVETEGDPAARVAAVRLAGLWKAEVLRGAIRLIAEAAGTAPALRASALDALASMGDKAGIEALLTPGRPLPVRAQAVAALARVDVGAAAARAAEVLRDAGKGREDVSPLLAAFLNQRGGADTLASALAGAKLAPDAAKLALRAVYTLGRSDAALVAVLSRAAGIDSEVKPLDPAAMNRLIADVAAKGDPGRGEAVFRRADVNCTKCHAVSGAGGGVGPDLSAIGSSSPVDYIINSIMLPDQAIKEEFHTLIVLTAEGQVFQGVVADKDDTRVILREATGELRTIAASDIEESKEGGSLMPKGLVNFMTRAELVDLVRFLSELGKPGPYAIRATPTVQRWRSLSAVPEPLSKTVPDLQTFRALVLDADPGRWLPAYARTAGALPLDELAVAAGGPVLYLRAEVEVSRGGALAVKLDSADGVHAWVDAKPAPPGAGFTTPMATGRHTLTFRVDAAARKDKALKVEVLKPAGSSAEYAVVGGR